MKEFLSIFQIIVSILLIGVIIMQNRGSQVGMAFGGAGESFRSKRGIEKVLFYLTIILAILFASSSILSLIIVQK